MLKEYKLNTVFSKIYKVCIYLICRLNNKLLKDFSIIFVCFIKEQRYPNSRSSFIKRSSIASKATR